jgi:aspartyl-tRNA(Asn)/glutamyl-tRNA(Gln) amidotransferase subunit A
MLRSLREEGSEEKQQGGFVHELHYQKIMTRRAFTLTAAGALASAHLNAQTPDVTSLSLAEAARGIRNKALTSVQLTEACLQRAQSLNPVINAYITIMKESAMAQARVLDAEARAGKFRGPLHGVPLALKDNIDTAGTRTTAASAVFDDRVPKEDAEVTRRLKAAGAVIIGKTNMHEFANGITSATSYFGPVRNPWALDRNSGGSSGGSAAAVISESCYGALGTDTGGSIRVPASYCNLVGLKPTHGLVSIRGIIPLVMSLDHCGPITRTVEDAAILLGVLAGYDRLDIVSVRHDAEDYVGEMKQSVKGLRLGIPRAPYFDALDADVAKLVEDAIQVMKGLTHSVADVTLPSVRGINTGAEFYAYHQDFYQENVSRYQIPTRRNLSKGNEAKAADYIKSMWRLQMLRRTIDDAFTDFDLVVLPTRRHSPRTIDASIKREETDKPRNPELENTSQFNVMGIPAVSVPCGFTAAGLPIGVMIAGPSFTEGRVLAMARAYEQATEWHRKRPVLTPGMKVPPLARTTDDSE